MKKYCVTDYGVVADSDKLQTKEIQAVLDMCKNGGGTVVVPKGKYYLAAVRMWANTTLYLESGAELYEIGKETVYGDIIAFLQTLTL